MPSGYHKWYIKYSGQYTLGLSTTCYHCWSSPDIMRWEFCNRDKYESIQWNSDQDIHFRFQQQHKTGECVSNKIWVFFFNYCLTHGNTFQDFLLYIPCLTNNSEVSSWCFADLIENQNHFIIFYIFGFNYSKMSCLGNDLNSYNLYTLFLIWSHIIK